LAVHLLDLDGRERYHTLAALVETGDAIVDSERCRFLGWDPLDSNLRVSHILHEITHVASFRTTRLGFWIARVGAALLQARGNLPRHARLDVPESAHVLLGAFAPLLEGLALYAQLDYEADNVDSVLPFPLNKITANQSAIALSTDPLKAMRFAREMAISSGILSDLFVVPNPATAHYFAGYLYVKAVAAKIARVAPSLDDASTLLPLLVRLICDHPVIELMLQRNLNVDDAIAAIHASLRDLTSARIETIAKMLEVRQFRDDFDNWDIHAQLARGGASAAPVLHSDANPLFAGMEESHEYRLLRWACNVYSTYWTSGKLAACSDDGGELTLRLAGASGEWTASIWMKSRLVAFQRDMTDEFLALHAHFDDALREIVRQAAASRAVVTIANYLTLTKGVQGTAVWVNGQLRIVIPSSLVDNRLDETEMELAVAGLALAPDERLDFAQRLRRSDTQSVARSRASELLMQALVSDPVWRAIALECRLTGVLVAQPARDALVAWCERAVYVGRADPIVTASLTPIFDRLHFGGGPFSDLLPNVTPIHLH
jgi:hypothetical protein